jgi:hypothetical protein
MLYKTTNSLLNQQLHAAYDITKNTLQNFDVDQVQNLQGNWGNFGNMINSAKNSLGAFENQRWLNNKPITDVTKNLLAASVATGVALNECISCSRKLGVEVGTLNGDQKSRIEALFPKLADAVQRSGSNEDLEELFKCFIILARDAGCNLPDKAASVFQGSITNLGDFSNVSQNDKAVAAVISNLMKSNAIRTTNSSPVYGKSE